VEEIHSDRGDHSGAHRAHRFGDSIFPSALREEVAVPDAVVLWTIGTRDPVLSSRCAAY
jgi:hypothetical protein